MGNRSTNLPSPVETVAGLRQLGNNRRMTLTRREIHILIVNLIYIPIFAIVAMQKLNFEFLLYVGVVILALGFIVAKQHKVKLEPMILWGLTIWGFMHLSGGNIRVGGEVLYELILVPLVPHYNILRYDQVVHVLGFCMATLVCHHLLKPYLRTDITKWRTLCLLIVLMGSGVGAFNEIIEFIAQETVPETHVGGYTNTMLDLIANLTGGLLAVTWLALKRRSAVAFDA